MGRSEVDRVLADLKYRLVKKLDEEELELAIGDPYGSEYSCRCTQKKPPRRVVKVHLPEERQRIGDLLQVFPAERETKIEKLLAGLGTLWRQNPKEKVVIFATYLGTVDLTRGGDRDSLSRSGRGGAARRRSRREGGGRAAFPQKDGPRVLVCTAAGREGINLQFARILFNFDLPWNPMDVEQRIGRIHRYGQKDTAQVYNLILSDTIEGRIFLLLDEKLTAIAALLARLTNKAMWPKTSAPKFSANSLRELNYERLYQQALADPELKRTKVELEAALTNAKRGT